MNRRQPLLRLVVSLLLLAMVAAACSNADDGGSAAETPADDPVAEAASAELAGLLERPTSIGVTEPLEGDVPADKTVYWIQCGVIACVSLGDAIEEATGALGWNLVRVEAGLSPETIKNAWGEAARAVPAPDAVLSSGFPREIFEEEIQSLAARDIPVVNLSVADTAGDGLTAVVGGADVRNVQAGEIQALWVLAEKGEAADTVVVQVPAFPTHAPQGEAFQAKYEELCPECPLDFLEVPAESIGTDLPERIVAYLQANQDVTSVVMSFGDMAIGVPSAVRDAGLHSRVTVVTDTPDPTVAQYIADDDVVTAATGYPGPEMAWRGVDIALRHMLGSDIAPSVDAELPSWVLTSDNIPDTENSFPLVEDYANQYKTLWGVQ